MGCNEDQPGCLKAVRAQHCILQQGAPLLPHGGEEEEKMEEKINYHHAHEEDISSQTAWETLLGHCGLSCALGGLTLLLPVASLGTRLWYSP